LKLASLSQAKNYASFRPNREKSVARAWIEDGMPRGLRGTHFDARESRTIAEGVLPDRPVSTFWDPRCAGRIFIRALDLNMTILVHTRKSYWTGSSHTSHWHFTDPSGSRRKINNFARHS